MANVNGIMFMFEWHDAIANLDAANYQAVICALFDYARNRQQPKLTGAAQMAFGLIAPQMDKMRAKYEKDVENGKKGGAPKGNQNAKKETTQNNPKTTKDKIKQNNTISPTRGGDCNNINSPNPSPSSLGAKGEDLEKKRAEEEARANREMWNDYPNRVKLPEGCRYDEKIGPYEFRDPEGNRRYSLEGPIIPEGMEPRPVNSYRLFWNNRDGSIEWSCFSDEALFNNPLFTLYT